MGVLVSAGLTHICSVSWGWVGSFGLPYVFGDQLAIGWSRWPELGPLGPLDCTVCHSLAD